MVEEPAPYDDKQGRHEQEEATTAHHSGASHEEGHEPHCAQKELTQTPDGAAFADHVIKQNGPYGGYEGHRDHEDGDHDRLLYDYGHRCTTSIT